MWYRYVCLVVLVCLPSVSAAQMGGLDGLTAGNQEPTITLDPLFPSPGQSFTATVQDFSRTVFGSEITWSYNGTVIEEGSNQRSVELVAPAAGGNYELTAQLVTPVGLVQLVTTTINPIFIDIIIEPQTRVPDWYSGRALPSYASQINATILLHDGTDFLDPNQHVYTWRINQQAIEGGALRGGHKVSFATPRGSTPVLVVSVNDTRGTAIASRAITMPSLFPELFFYEKHSLYGVRNIPLQPDVAVVGGVLNLQAEPYFLDTRVYNRPDIAAWEINSVSTDTGSSNPYEITLSRVGSGGRTLLQFHVRSLQEVLQGVEEQIMISF